MRLSEETLNSTLSEGITLRDWLSLTTRVIEELQDRTSDEYNAWTADGTVDPEIVPGFHAWCAATPEMVLMSLVGRIDRLGAAACAG